MSKMKKKDIKGENFTIQRKKENEIVSLTDEQIDKDIYTPYKIQSQESKKDFFDGRDNKSNNVIARIEYFDTFLKTVIENYKKPLQKELNIFISSLESAHTKERNDCHGHYAT